MNGQIRDIMERLKRFGLLLKLTIVEHQQAGRPITFAGDFWSGGEKYECTVRIVRVGKPERRLKPVK